MSAAALFIVTNYLGISFETSVFCQSVEEGKRILEKELEYPPKDIIFKRFMIGFNELEWPEVDYFEERWCTT